VEGRLLKIIRDHDGEVLSLAWGEVLVSGCADGKVRELDPESATARVVRTHDDWVTSVVLSGRRVISADASGRVER
jgi:WD40 repeat protein